MAHYKAIILHMSLDELNIRNSYKDTHLSRALCSVIGQLRTSSHQLEIEISRYESKPKVDLCYLGVEYKLSANVVFFIKLDMTTLLSGGGIRRPLYLPMWCFL